MTAARTFDGLFAADVGLAEASAAMWDGYQQLFEQERRSLARALSKRRREFTAGRLCARSLLAEFGHAEVALPVGDQGMPLWPAGIVGSISHCADRCVVAVAAGNRYLSVGLDVEPIGPLRQAIVKMVCTEREREMSQRWSRVEEDWSKIVFSAKESCYKCYFPLARHVLDFLDIEVRIDTIEKTFIATLLGDELPPAAGRREFVGRYRRQGGHLLTGASLQAV